MEGFLLQATIYLGAAVISVPNRYMHTPVEMIHLNDLENCAKLMAEFAASVSDKTNFKR